LGCKRLPTDHGDNTERVQQGDWKRTDGLFAVQVNWGWGVRLVRAGAGDPLAGNQRGRADF